MRLIIGTSAISPRSNLEAMFHLTNLDSALNPIFIKDLQRIILAPRPPGWAHQGPGMLRNDNFISTKLSAAVANFGSGQSAHEGPHAVRHLWLPAQMCGRWPRGVCASPAAPPAGFSLSSLLRRAPKRGQSPEGPCAHTWSGP
jgi:hypothetical protein